MIYVVTHKRKLSAIESYKKRALLTMGATLVLLGLLLPAVYADSNVVGNGKGIYNHCVAGIPFSSSIGFSAKISSADNVPSSGVWHITTPDGKEVAGGSITRGTITSGVTAGELSYTLGGLETFGCNSGGVFGSPITISGTCGTDQRIAFIGSSDEKGTFSGKVDC